MCRGTWYALVASQSNHGWVVIYAPPLPTTPELVTGSIALSVSEVTNRRQGPSPTGAFMCTHDVQLSVWVFV